MNDNMNLLPSKQRFSLIYQKEWKMDIPEYQNMERGSYQTNSNQRVASQPSFRRSGSTRKQFNKENANLSESREASNTLNSIANNTFRYSVDRERSLNLKK
jgi:hypothetical protein